MDTPVTHINRSTTRLTEEALAFQDPTDRQLEFLFKSQFVSEWLDSLKSNPPSAEVGSCFMEQMKKFQEPSVVMLGTSI